MATMRFVGYVWVTVDGVDEVRSLSASEILKVKSWLATFFRIIKERKHRVVHQRVKDSKNVVFQVSPTETFYGSVDCIRDQWYEKLQKRLFKAHVVPKGAYLELVQQRVVPKAVPKTRRR